MESKTFVVYKSSAGSGKTYTLVKEYLKLVLNNPAKVRHILAITFTNAASAEMKERIIKALAELVAHKRGYLDPLSKESKGVKSLIKQIIAETSLDETKLLDNSEKVLYYILHNYNDFSISTIDSFTHRILRTFAYDLKIPVNFEVEFDTQQTIEQAADILINRAGAKNNPELTNLLVNFIESRTDEERSFAIEREIIQMAGKMLNEESIYFIEKLKDKNISDLMKVYGKIKIKLDEFKKLMVESGKKALAVIDRPGIQITSLAYGERGIYSWFKKLATGRLQDCFPVNSYTNKFINEDKWHSAKAKEQNDVEAINNIAPELRSIAETIIARADTELKDYLLLDNIRHNLFSVALINEMGKIMDDIRWEENILFIADFNKKISDFIAHEPVPFIYERVGEKYENYMIDEFQDTSVLQWQNMLPLIENSLAKGNMSLLVGDAKQSIYRWRGGDAQQFIKLPKLTDKIFSVDKAEVEKLLERNCRQVPENPEEPTVNYRSEKNIVEFNNHFFKTIKPDMPDLLKEVYKGHMQKCNKPGSGGYVEITFVPERNGEKELFEKEMVEKVNGIISELVKGKYNYSDIAVLCRKKKEAAAVAQHLTQKGLFVVSEESLLLSSSDKVNFLVSLLRIINNNEDSPALTECVEFLHRNNIIKQPGDLHLCLKEIFLDNDNSKSNNFERFIALLNKNGINIPSMLFSASTVFQFFEEAVRVFFHNQKNICPYLAFFFDCIHEYQQTRQNSISGFLHYWDENKDKFSLVIPDKLNAVKVITIHKSKGLQFPVVIYPFANERSRMKAEDGFWVNVDNNDIPELQVAYIGARKSLLETDCSWLYIHEEESRMLDLINLTYVAFTRPQEKLYVISSKPESGNFPKNSLSNILYEYLKNSGLWSDEKMVYTFPFEKEKVDMIEGGYAEKNLEDDGGRKWLTNFINEPWRKKITTCIFDQPLEPGQINRITRGKAVHRAMENILTPEDIPVAVEQLVVEGYVLKDESESLKKNISGLVNNSLIKPFFSDKHTVKTEPGIFDSNGNFYRPDRIAFSPGQTAVIDYKTGMPNEKYKYQIRKYGKLLDEMNYKNVKLFIVYIDQNIINEIK